ncbi:MAG: gluconate 2-dehydrogenase subunit 3 family protein [bacterium]
MQEVYRAGLARLDVRARERAGVAFVALPSTEQDALLGDRGDDALQEFVGTALMNTLEATYGPPEYGGNRDGVGWLAARWDGDVEPRGYDDAEVSEPSGVTTTLDAASAAALVERFLGALAASRLRHAGAIPSRRSSRVAR